MQKAMFFEEAYHKGVLAKIDSGYILSVMVPDMTDPIRKQDPFKIEMVSYSGVKSVIPVPGGVKFQASGRKMYCMVEPATYPKSHIEPSMRSTHTTEHMPYRFNECDVNLTSDSKYRTLVAKKALDSFDSFTIEFPDKGDIAVLYFIFDDDINGKVLPFIQENFITILKSAIRLQERDAKKVSKQFLEVIKQFDVWPE
jgi:hypothetical protein